MSSIVIDTTSVALQADTGKLSCEFPNQKFGNGTRGRGSRHSAEWELAPSWIPACEVNYVRHRL